MSNLEQMLVGLDGRGLTYRDICDLSDRGPEALALDIMGKVADGVLQIVRDERGVMRIKFASAPVVYKTTPSRNMPSAPIVTDMRMEIQDDIPELKEDEKFRFYGATFMVRGVVMDFNNGGYEVRSENGVYDYVLGYKQRTLRIEAIEVDSE